jgi:hypothetical protein
MHMGSQDTLRLGTLGVAMLMIAAPVPAFGLDNPLTAKLRGTTSHLREARATIFGAGSNVLVDVTRTRGVLDGSAVTLNAGHCQRPGTVVFTLAPFKKYGSVTQLLHPLADVARRAHSVVIHQTASVSSPAFACGGIVH